MLDKHELRRRTREPAGKHGKSSSSLRFVHMSWSSGVHDSIYLGLLTEHGDCGPSNRGLPDLEKMQAKDVHRAVSLEQVFTSPQLLVPAILKATESRHTPTHLKSDILEEITPCVLPLHQCERSPLEAVAQRESMSVQDSSGQEGKQVHGYLPQQNERDKYDQCAPDSDGQTDLYFLHDEKQSLPTFPIEGSHKRWPSISGENSAINSTTSVPFKSSPSRCNTMSSFADDDESDWGESEANGSVQENMYFPGFSSFPLDEEFSQEQIKDNLTRPVFSPLKQALIDSIMKEFWIIFNQEIEAIQ